MLAMALAGTPGSALFAAAKPPRAIDTHTHFYDPTRPGGVPWPPATDKLLYRRVLPADFRRVTAGLNIAGTVIVEASRLVEDNQWILDIAARDKFIKGFIGNLDPWDAAFPKHLERFAANPLFRGLRLSEGRLRDGMDSPAILANLRLLDQRGLTLDVIGGRGVLDVAARLSTKLPALRIVVDHLPFADQAGIAELKPHANVYAKVSGILREVDGRVPLDIGFYRTSLDEVWETFGAARVIYASNWPVSDKWGAYKQVHSIANQYFAEKGTAVLKGFLFENSRLAYNWVAR